MKKILLFVVALAVTTGCASSKKQDEKYHRQQDQRAARAASSQPKDQVPQPGAVRPTRFQIIDQEFDNMIAPEGDYDRVPPYEEQLGTGTYMQSTQKGRRKPGAKRTIQPKKVVTDGQGNVIPEPTAPDLIDEEFVVNDPAAPTRAE